jgi:hypothetical protein
MDYLHVLQAMRGEADASSPWLSPRSEKEDRRLIRRMAVMMGSTEVSTTWAECMPGGHHSNLSKIAVEVKHG